ncbi:MAG: Nramp family divalent metal transporter [Acidobacteria bacterium]|nr:Nramp family divalent metal transporter [Acidobacteriota bacterium]
MRVVSRREPPSRGSGERSQSPGWRDTLSALGPGLITGASDDDPSGIATYAQAGAQFGTSFLWVALLSFPLMAAVQEICDRSALATGSELGALVAKRFRRGGRTIVLVMMTVLMIANTLNIAADLVAVGSGMTMLHCGPTWVWALFAGVAVTVTVAMGTYHRISQIFRLLCLALLAYIIVAIMVTRHWGTVLTDAVIPRLEFNKGYVAMLVAILGTTISPYLFFWQSANRLEEMREEPEGGDEPIPLTGRRGWRARRKQHTSRIDVFGGMAFSNIVMFAIIATTAATLHAHHHVNIQSAAQAAESLRPLAGRLSSVVFALGFIGSGLLAIPVLAASGSVGISGLLGKEWGFSRSIREAPTFYALVAFGSLGGTAMSLLNVNAIKLLVFVAVINGIIAAPLLIVVMMLTGSRQIMGDYVNGKMAKTMGWLTVVIMSVATVAFFAAGGV